MQIGLDCLQLGVVPIKDAGSLLLGHETLLLLSEGVVSHDDLLFQGVGSLEQFPHLMRGKSFFFDVGPHELVHVNQAVGRLGRHLFSAEGFFHDDVFDLHLDGVVIESPPYVLLAVVDEGVVMASLGISVVNEDALEVVRDALEISEGILDLALLVLDLVFKFLFLVGHSVPAGCENLNCGGDFSSGDIEIGVKTGPKFTLGFTYW